MYSALLCIQSNVLIIYNLQLIYIFLLSFFSFHVLIMGIHDVRDRIVHDYATIVHTRPAFGTAISNDTTSHMDWGS